MLRKCANLPVNAIHLGQVPEEALDTHTRPKEPNGSFIAEVQKNSQFCGTHFVQLIILKRAVIL